MNKYVDTSDKLVVHETPTELGSFDVSNFPSNRDQYIDDMILAKQLFRRSSTPTSNCLLDTIFPKISTSSTQPDLLQRHFDLTVLVADNEGDIGEVDMQPITSKLQSDGEAIPIRMVVVNYNHYEPLFGKGKENFSLPEASAKSCLKQQQEDQRLQSKEDCQWLRPLEKKPLKEVKDLGYRFSTSDICEKYPEWYQVLSFHSVCLEGYLDNLERSRKRLAIPGAEEMVGQSGEKLIKIQAAVEAIVKQLSKKSPDLKQLQLSVDIIRVCAYELFVDPEKRVRFFIQTSVEENIWMVESRNKKFRELKKITGGDSLRKYVSDRILEAMSSEKISEEKEKLLKEYPREKEMIISLAETAEQLFFKAIIESAWKEIQDYKKTPRGEVLL